MYMDNAGGGLLVRKGMAVLTDFNIRCVPCMFRMCVGS